jgi:hypothetical protein
MSNKTERKNKTNLEVNWPATGELFTVKDLLTINPGFVEITLRTRLDKAVKKDGLVTVVGTKNTGKGRPTTIHTMSPVSSDVLEKAYASGIQPPDVKPVAVLTVSAVPESSTAQEVSITVPSPSEMASV